MIKDIMVHLDGTAVDEARIAQAEAIATIWGAHVTGLFTNVLPDYAMAMPVGAAAAGMSIVADLEQRAREEADASIATLVERFKRLSVPNEIRRFDATSSDIAVSIGRETRWADLIVAARPYGGAESGRWEDIVEAVLFGSGRAVYLVPPGNRNPGPVRQVLVAWRDTRETARAVAEALPFIHKAARTEIVIVSSSRHAATAEAGADIARHLVRHGATVSVSVVKTDDQSVSEALLEKARHISADLIVMGGYGHSRLREWILGGTTLDMLTTCDVPILMAH